MRLIDADALLKKEQYLTIKHGKQTVYVSAGHFVQTYYIENAPTVDAVPVVRCCDCKFGYPDLIDQGYMLPPAAEGMICARTKNKIEMDFTDFCSYGERKDGKENER